jgi:hypothetical protein
MALMNNQVCLDAERKQKSMIISSDLACHDETALSILSIYVRRVLTIDASW